MWVKRILTFQQQAEQKAFDLLQVVDPFPQYLPNMVTMAEAGSNKCSKLFEVCIHIWSANAVA